MKPEVLILQGPNWRALKARRDRQDRQTRINGKDAESGAQECEDMEVP
jgi:hypothetical protein